MNRGSVRVRVLATLLSVILASTAFAAPRDERPTTRLRDFERVVEKILKKIQKTFQVSTQEDAVQPPRP
jgi:hypothetical protein